ncbi:SGNH/GDSL hydrolase family protein [Rhodanobacter sp. C03]|uniref:SGNH/GDSL hydrolase family protein n=1 Tax=Rhodanobacter sp. C03 TaxID=1945858 RepID=UPI00098464B9|nr:SGNH/GDSL hydrolase family protein [Rhodanobacter sp. C03]OOG56961.1 capsular biosynthesis protein [Rhodanobacter sp. C03]
MIRPIAILAGLLYAGLVLAQTAAPSPDALMQRVAASEQRLSDWAELARYRDENSKLAAPSRGEARVVFMGDSITDFWGRSSGVFFPGKPYINRGISGQTTPQMLVRFRPDVIALKPRVVVILAGTNDLAGNTGPSTLGMIEDNLASMAELARAHHIKVVLASLTPVNDYADAGMTKGRPPQEIRELNAWIKSYAQRAHFVYLDYYDALLDTHQMLKKDLSADGLHPNAAGYAVMAPLAQQAIEQALRH